MVTKAWLDMTTEERVAFLRPLVGQRVRYVLAADADKMRQAYGKRLAPKHYEYKLLEISATDQGEPALTFVAAEFLGIPVPLMVKWTDIHSIEVVPDPAPQVKHARHASFCCPNCGHPLIVGKGQ